MDPRKFALFLFAMALGLSLFFWAFFDFPVRGDGHYYVRIGENLARGNGFSLDTAPPFKPTLFREPLYPAFLAFFFLLFGKNLAFVAFGQMVLFATTAISIYFVGRLLFSESVARLSSIAVALSPTLANYACRISMESFLTFLITFAVWMTLLAQRRKEIRFLVSGGFCWGLVALCRTPFQIFLPIAALSFLLSEGKASARLKKSFCFLAVSLLVVLPWTARNFLFFKESGFTARGKSNLYVRASRLSYTPEQLKAYTLFCVSESLARRFYPQYEITSSGKDSFFYESVRKKEKELPVTRYDPKFDAILGDEALTVIREHPFKYAALGGLELLKLSAFLHIPQLNRAGAADKMALPLWSRWTIVTLRGALRLLGFVLLMLTFFAMIHHRNRFREWSLPALCILYVFGFYALFDADARYGVSVIPCIFLFSAESVIRLSRKMVHERLAKSALESAAAWQL